MTEIAVLAIGFVAGMLAMVVYTKNKVVSAELERDRAQRKVVEVERDCDRKVSLAETIVNLSPQEHAIRELIAKGAISDYTGYYILARHAHGDIDFQVPSEDAGPKQEIPW